MKRIVLFLSVLIVVVAFALFLRTFLPTPSPSPTTLVKMSVVQKEEKFIVGEYNGKVAVFSQNGELKTVYDVPISTLPEDDQTMLRKGIVAQGQERLRSLIEDYTS